MSGPKAGAGLAAVVLLLAASMAGCIPGPDSITVGGVVELGGGEVDDLGDCGASSGDLTAGTEVVITDAEGTTLATGQLEPGEPYEYVDERLHTSSPDVCHLPFTIARVPTGHGTYGITVGSHPPVQYSEDELGPNMKLAINQFSGVLVDIDDMWNAGL